MSDLIPSWMKLCPHCQRPMNLSRVSGKHFCSCNESAATQFILDQNAQRVSAKATKDPEGGPWQENCVRAMEGD